MSENIKTRDGQEAAYDSTMTLSHRRLNLVVKASRGPMKEALGTVLRALGNDPRSFAVADVESDFARQLSDLIGGVQVRVREGQTLEAIWIPLPEAVMRLAAVQVKRVDAEKANAAEDEAARAVARQRLVEDEEKAKKRMEAQRAMAELVKGLVPTDMLRHPEARRNDDEYKRLAAVILSWIEGRAAVNDLSRPSALSYEGKQVAVLDFHLLAKQLDGLRGAEPEHLVITCAFCGKQHALGADEIVRDKNKLGERTAVARYMVRQIKIGAMLPDGSGPYLNMFDDTRNTPPRFRKGESRKQSIPVCRSCGRIASGLSPRMKGNDGKEMPSILPTDVLPSFKKFRSGFQSNQSSGTYSGQQLGRLVASADPDGTMRIVDEAPPATVAALQKKYGDDRRGKSRGKGKGRREERDNE